MISTCESLIPPDVDILAWTEAVVGRIGAGLAELNNLFDSDKPANSIAKVVVWG